MNQNMTKQEHLQKAYEKRGVTKGFIDESINAMEDAMESYAKEKCKEQRENCFKEMKHQKFGFYKAKKDTVLNAPEPKFN